MEEKDKIQEILAMQDRQLQIDVIKMMEENNVTDKENTFKEIINEEPAEKKLTSHREFMERIKPASMKEVEHTTTNKTKEDKQEER